VKLMHKTFETTCPLAPQTASERIESLLSQEGVKFSTAELRITSTRTPIVVLGVQSKLYTRRNWVGLNPFAFITGVDIWCEPGDSAAATKVNVRVNRRRSILWAAVWALCGYFSGRAMPQPAGTALFVVVIFAAWFGIVSFLGGHLVKKEIVDVLKV
jgi:hypothetical protein